MLKNTQRKNENFHYSSAFLIVFSVHHQEREEREYRKRRKTRKREGKSYRTFKHRCLSHSTKQYATLSWSRGKRECLWSFIRDACVCVRWWWWWKKPLSVRISVTSVNNIFSSFACNCTWTCACMHACIHACTYRFLDFLTEVKNTEAKNKKSCWRMCSFSCGCWRLRKTTKRYYFLPLNWTFFLFFYLLITMFVWVTFIRHNFFSNLAQPRKMYCLQCFSCCIF